MPDKVYEKLKAQHIEFHSGEGKRGQQIAAPPSSIRRGTPRPARRTAFSAQERMDRAAEIVAEHDYGEAAFTGHDQQQHFECGQPSSGAGRDDTLTPSSADSLALHTCEITAVCDREVAKPIISESILINKHKVAIWKSPDELPVQLR